MPKKSEPTNNLSLWLTFAGGVIVAVITLIGGIYTVTTQSAIEATKVAAQRDIERDKVLLPLTVEAQRTQSAAQNISTSTVRTIPPSPSLTATFTPTRVATATFTPNATLKLPQSLGPESYSWVQRSPSNFPLSGAHYGIAYDSKRRVFVLYGGSPAWNTFSPETWEWDGRNWLHKQPPVSPSPRSQHTMSFDSRRGVVVLFGGNNGNVKLNETWEYNGNAWSPVQTDVAPPPMERGCSTFDEKRGLLVMFGGGDDNAGTAYDDTWTYDGMSWTKQKPLQSPHRRKGCAMAYDSKRDSVILFGGAGNSGSLDDTWEWNSSNWAERKMATRPPARQSHSLVYHSGLGMILAFGGDKGSCSVLYEDTWAWDGNRDSWQRLPTNNPGTHAVIMSAYSPQMDSVLLFGGWAGGNGNCRITTETWEYILTYQR